MLKNYLKIAFRNILRNKVYSFINIAGLGIGIAGSLLILVYVVNQLSYDSMQKNREQIVRVSVVLGGGGSSMTLAGAMPALGPAAAAVLPEVRAAVRFRVDHNAAISVGNKKFTENSFFFADSNVFKVFTFPFVSGNEANALDDPSSIVISQSIAQKYFGNVNPIGRTLTYDNKYDFIVSGVMKDVPANTMLRPQLIAPYSRAVEILKVQDSWGSFGADYTYLYLRRGTSLSKLPGELEELLIRNTNRSMASLISFKVVPLSDIHFTPGIMGELGPTVNRSSVDLFSMIAILVLIVACLNFVNLSTARSIQRSKEVGLRKVVGARKGGLVWQFFVESLIVTLLSLLIALVIFELVAPSLYSLFNAESLLRSYLNAYSVAVFIGVVFFVAALAGLYPAVFISRYAPVDSLRGTTTPGSSGNTLRKALVVTQFAIAVFLLIGTAVIFKQVNFMRNSDLGFNKKGVVVLNLPQSSAPAADKYPVLEQAFNSIPGVLDISGAGSLPAFSWYQVQDLHVQGKPEAEYSMIQTIAVDYNYLQTLQLELLQGRNFSRKFSADSDNACLLNQAAVMYLGLRDPIGSQVYLPSTRMMKVIGVTKDFHVTSFQKKMGPLLLYMSPTNFKYIALRIDQSQSSRIIPALKFAWEKILPGTGFDYSFLSQTYDNLYKSDDKTGGLVSIFSLLAILIACMGLFGLASYSVERRTKEIGIRKVLGASVPEVVFILSEEFTKWVLVANAIAWPVAYYLMRKWLENFAYRTTIGFWIFPASGGLVLIVALLTVGTHAVRAATANPVEALRYE
ncbi:MAG: ABC transporter permease [Bacteroidetes bacterium]|nr:ABC transporter permease [Bacteroidota bacterium]